MKFSKNSLGGKNNHGRMSGARSSRASSTIIPNNCQELVSDNLTEKST